MTEKTGTLVISLDFELYWGCWPGEDKSSRYKESLYGARKAIPKVLELFKSYQIHCTWAVVGFLFFSHKKDLLKSLPALQPTYENHQLSWYPMIDQLAGADESQDPVHYGSSLIEQIRRYPFQEIASHTFSHYYCLQPGQTEDQFRSDLQMAVEVAARAGVELKSLVFPLNQFNPDYLKICKELGIVAFRGNPTHPIFRDLGVNHSRVNKALRLFDTYFDLSGHHCFEIQKEGSNGIINVRWSRFLRPYNKYLVLMEPLKWHRIKRDMYHAAKNGLAYHLWCHPCNFGLNIDKNIAFLEKICQYYQQLNRQYGYKSLTMHEVAEIALRRSR